MNRSLIIQLVAFNVNLQIAHWVADSRTNEHSTLGHLYERMTELTDELAEVALGKDGQAQRAFPDGLSINITPNATQTDLLNEGLAILAAIRAEVRPGAGDDLLNIVADMSAAIHRARYLLQLL